MISARKGSLSLLTIGLFSILLLGNIISVMFAQNLTYREKFRFGRGTITVSAWSPDGSTIAVGGSQGISLYTPEFNLIGHLDTGSTLDIAWHPVDHLLSVRGESNIVLWDIDTNEGIATINETGCPMAFSPDGTRIAVGRINSEIAVYDLSGTLQTLYQGHTGQLATFSWKRDKPEIVSIAGDGRGIHTWSAETGELVQISTLENYTSFPACYGNQVWSPDQEKIFGISTDSEHRHTFATWQVTTGKPIAYIERFPSLPDMIWTAWSPDGTKIVSVDIFQTIRIWNADDLSIFRTVNRNAAFPDGQVLGYWEPVTTLTWSPDSRFIFTSNIGDGRIYDVETGEETAHLQGYMTVANDLAWNPNGTFLASGHGFNDRRGDNRLRIWDTNTGGIINTCEGYSGYIRSVDWNTDGTRIAGIAGNTNQSNAIIRIWDQQTCQVLSFQWLQTVAAIPIDWNLEDKLAAAVDKVMIYDSSFNQLAAINTLSFFPTWSPNGSNIAVDDTRNNIATLNIYESSSYQPIASRTFSIQLHEIAWSPNGEQIAIVDKNNAAYIWDIRSDQLSQPDFLSPIYTQVAWGEQNLLALATTDGEIHIWDINSETQVAVLDAEGNVIDLEWSPDGTQLASANDTGLIIIWEQG